jgi:alpha-methylacyl-CoA racemase
MHTKLAAIFKTKTREQWTLLMEQKEICYAPVLRMSEALSHPQNVHRGSFIEVAGVTQPGPAPKFAHMPSTPPRDPAHAGEHTTDGLTDWGISKAEIAGLLQSGAAKQR